MKNVDFAGDSEAAVAFVEADPDGAVDGLDQEHLGHHQDLQKGPGQGSERQKKDPENSIQK